MAIDDNTQYSLSGAQVKDIAARINSGAVKILTSSDYNYPTATPDCIWPGLLSDGVYSFASGVSVKWTTGNYYFTDGGLLIVGPSPSSTYDKRVFAITKSSLRNVTAVNDFNSSGTNAAYVVDMSPQDNLTTTSNYMPLAASQGKVLNDKIEGRVKTLNAAPSTSTQGTKGQLLEDTSNGKLYICTDATNPYVWEEVGTGGGSTGLVTLSYGNSTWQDFIDAYTAGEIVYCRASSNANPATGDQTRMAFMAYVNNPTTPTEVEFQYVRSVSSKTAAQPCDQVFVYKLTSTGGGTWTVESRNVTYKVAAGTNVTTSYSSGTVTINADAPVITMTDTDPGEGVALAANNFIAVYNAS